MNGKMGEQSWWTKAGFDPGRFVGRDASATEAKARSGFLAKARRHFGQIPMARQAVAMYFCLADPTPRWVKAIVAAALAYFVLPLDAIPDFLPFVGLGTTRASSPPLMRRCPTSSPTSTGPRPTPGSAPEPT